MGVLVELVQVRHIHIVGGSSDRRVVQVRCDVLEMFCDVARPELLSREEVDERGVVKHVFRDILRWF